MKLPDSDRRPDPRRVEEVFHAAAALPAGEQTVFLVRACAGDVRLETAVRALLAAGRQADGAWSGTALELEARHSALAAYVPHHGEFFGPYRIVRRIAAGGMSLVYDAVRDDAEFHKRVAIKFVQGIDDAAGIERFRSERQILAELEHPNIARLLDGGTTADGVPYLVMEYVDGVPIDRFAVERRVPRTDRLRLFLQVCDAVQYAHRNLVVHRDLKPANILVTRDGVPKLLDFGIAKMLSGNARTATVQALTPEYASPEQVLGRPIGTATDVYSLGVLLFVLLADRLPYRADASRAADLMNAVCREEPTWQPAGLIHGDLRSILGQALRKEPERRYLSVEQFAADVRRYLEARPVAARPDAWLYRARKFVVRRAVPLAAMCAIAIAVIAGAGATIAQRRRAERRFNEVRTLAHSVLFDMYDSIAPLSGSLGARRLVATRAQEYLDRLAREAVNDPTLTRDLAESYLRLGDVQGKPYRPNLGDTAGALVSYQKGLGLLEREAALHPSDLAIQEELALAYINTSIILTRQKKADDSISVANRAIALAQRVTDHDPRSARFTEELATAYLRLGQAQAVAADQSGSLDDLRQVLATYLHAIAVLQGGGAHSEEFWKERLAGLYFYVGYALRDLGDRTGDLEYHRQALDFSLKGDAINRSLLAADPANVSDVRRFADGLASLAPLRWKCCADLAGALGDQRQARDSFQTIVDRDPQNVEARRDLANAYNNLGLILEQANRRSEALEADRRALAAYEPVARADPTSAEDAKYVAQMRARITALERGR